MSLEENNKKMRLLSSFFFLSVMLWCKLSLAVCASTEVQGNYWNIWMAGPSLNPLTNDAWLLQKGTGRTRLPLTDKSHQRSMTSPTIVGWREAVRASEMSVCGGGGPWHTWLWPCSTVFLKMERNKGKGGGVTYMLQIQGGFSVSMKLLRTSTSIPP